LRARASLERHLRAAQLLVLHFEFDLIHAQFVQRALRRFGEHGFGSCHAETGLAAQAFLRTRAQGGADARPGSARQVAAIVGGLIPVGHRFFLFLAR
jgi:hypothetical protein